MEDLGGSDWGSWTVRIEIRVMKYVYLSYDIHFMVRLVRSLIDESFFIISTCKFHHFYK